ncbi:unnamed protein product, partial [Musa textilis]
DPAEADKLFKIQRDLDQTKIISSRQFSALAEGEKLDSLVEKSSDLSVKKKNVNYLGLGQPYCCTRWPTTIHGQCKITN